MIILDVMYGKSPCWCTAGVQEVMAGLSPYAASLSDEARLGIKQKFEAIEGKDPFAGMWIRSFH